MATFWFSFALLLSRKSSAVGGHKFKEIYGLSCPRGQRREVTSRVLTASPHFLPSFIENSRTGAVGGRCSGRSGTRPWFVPASGPRILRRRYEDPTCSDQPGDPFPVALSATGVYLHRAEPQQLIHDSSTATPWADMVPRTLGSTAQAALALDSRGPGCASQGRDGGAAGRAQVARVGPAHW